MQALRPSSLVCLFALLTASCAGRSRWPAFSTQQWPEPMENTVTPLPPGIEAQYPPGPEEVIIRRLADPVQIKPAGQHAAFPLRYYDKRRRANAGAWVFCSAGGRAEILWPDSATTIVLYDYCTGIIGSPSRGEPNFMFREIQRTVLMLHDGDQVELLGGALLTANSGPWLIERRSFEILRVRNQSKVPGEVAYRNEVFNLGPGQTLDLPLLSAGGAPIPDVPGTETYAGPGFDMQAFGDVDLIEMERGIEVSGQGEHEIKALGVRLHLAPNETARFSGLSGAGDSVSGEPMAPEVIELPVLVAPPTPSPDAATGSGDAALSADAADADADDVDHDDADHGDADHDDANHDDADDAADEPADDDAADDDAADDDAADVDSADVDSADADSVPGEPAPAESTEPPESTDPDGSAPLK